MLAKKLLDDVQVWSDQIDSDQGVDKLQKLICGPRREAVHRVRHNVGVNVLSEMKPNREAARTGILRVIVGDEFKCNLSRLQHGSRLAGSSLPPGTLKRSWVPASWIWTVPSTSYKPV